MSPDLNIDKLYQIAEACTLRNVIGANGESAKWEIIPDGGARFVLPELPSKVSAKTIFERESHMKAFSKAFGMAGELNDWATNSQSSTLTLLPEQLQNLSATLLKAKYLDLYRDRTSDPVGWKI